MNLHSNLNNSGSGSFLTKLNLINPQIIPNQSIDPYLLNLIQQKKPLKQSFINKLEIKVVYFGVPGFSAYILEKLIKTFNNPPSHLNLDQDENLSQPKFIIQTVVTSPDKPVGRKQIITPSPVAQVAEKCQIPVLKPDKLSEDFIKGHLSLLDSDLFIVIAYGKIIPQQLLDIPRLGPINVHYSLLPKYRGASPIQQAILNGDKQSGITIMLMNQKMDEGPILEQEIIHLSDKDTFESLSKKMSQQAISLLISTLADFVAGKLTPRPQDESQATYCRPGKKSTLVDKNDGYFEINNPPDSEILDRMIRAYYPWPGAWTKWKERVVKLYPEDLIQMEGKKPIPLKNFLNGYPDFPIKEL